MSQKDVLAPLLYFSYRQFMVYDESVALPGCAWTEEHSRQGFARREAAVCFSTPLEFGHAEVTVGLSAFEPGAEYDRVIAVPFLVTSGRVIVEGPEEATVERSFSLAPGNYRLVAAQRVTGEEREAIDLFFELLVRPMELSSIIVADDALDPPTPLVETAGIAGGE